MCHYLENNDSAECRAYNTKVSRVFVLPVEVSSTYVHPKATDCSLQKVAVKPLWDTKHDFGTQIQT